MNLFTIIWMCILLLSSYFKSNCNHIIRLGELKVEPAPLFLLGSNLTVFCKVNKNKMRSNLYLEINHENVSFSRWINNTTTTVFFLHNVWVPKFSVVCKMKCERRSDLCVVNGINLRGGLPPDKPENIICETTRSSEVIFCSWHRGQETHLSRSYNVSVSSENFTQLYFNQISGAEEISIPRRVLDENTKFILMISAYNPFGASQSDPIVLLLKDIVIPEAPQNITVEFENNSMSAILDWKASDSLRHLWPCIRLRAENDSWSEREGSELNDGRLLVNNFKPLTEYELQMRACDSASAMTCTSASTLQTNSSQRFLCSKWSHTVKTISPAKRPSQQLIAWRTFGDVNKDGTRSVVVLWKPLPAGDYSGNLLHYKIFLADGHEETCSPNYTSCSVQVPAGVHALNVCADTEYGMSPPATVDLRHSDVLGPGLEKLVTAANSEDVLITWHPTSEEEPLYYVIEWASVPVTVLQWKKLANDSRNTTIIGLTPGVRYNVSLYAVNPGGISAPSFSLIYSREKKPDLGPDVSVLAHEARQILIQWDSLPVHQQRGFITEYTIYMHTLDSSGTKLNVTVSASSPRKMWLNCPEGSLALQMTASNSAGEGPRGRRTFSQRASPTVGLVIVIVFVFTIFVVIVVNLMYWNCVRQWVKQKCVSWGPSWMVENLPKPGHSNAIRLLENDQTEPFFSYTDSDPPLSPITVISQEEEDVYPVFHVETSLIGSEPAAGLSSPATHTDTKCFEHGNYKPQIPTLISPVEEVKPVMHQNAPTEENCGFKELLRGLLSGVIVDISDSSQGHTLGSVTGLLGSKTAETRVSNEVISKEQEESDEDEEVDSLFLELHQHNMMTPHATEISNGDYFPQVAVGFTGTSKQK